MTTTRDAVSADCLHRNKGPSGWAAHAAGRVLRNAPALDACRRVVQQVGRFAGVGIASSLLYALVVTLEASALGMAPGLSAVLAYAVTIPFNFLLHRHFTFRSTRQIGGDMARYSFAQALSAIVSYVVMVACVDGLGLPYGFGILGSIVLVPIMTYLLMDRWVFAKAAA